MLRFAEEILLLALDDATGKLLPLPDRALDFALAGSVLAELTFQGRITTDPKHVMIVDSSPTGDPVLDEVVQNLPESDQERTLHNCLTRVAAQGHRLRDRTLQGLMNKGILKCEDDRFLWVFHLRRYPVVDDREEKEVRRRIRDVVLKEEKPGPRDVVLIALMNVCQLSYTVFTEEELERVGDRIQTVASMDFIGQAMTNAIDRIQRAILEIRAYSGI